MPVQDFSLPIVGAPYPNKDGSNRQFEIRLCTRGERLELLPDPKNKYDEHAIAVFSIRGVQIGYLTSERAPYVATLIRAGHSLHALFQQQMDWGAVARIGVDREPTLPPEVKRSASQEAWVDEDPGFYPDDPPADDWL